MFIKNVAGSHESFSELFERHPKNPILQASDWPYPANTVFNPAAVIFENKTLLLARVEDRRGFSHLTKAISENGFDGWVIDKEPTLRAEPDKYPEEQWGIEDPRITWMEHLNKWAVAYTAFSARGPLVSLALTTDFVHFEKIGPIMSPDDKDAAFFPKQFNDKYMLIHRPSSGSYRAHIWLSSSKDMKDWGDHHTVMYARKGGWWDSAKIGLSPPPLETELGWLIMYHGVKYSAAGGQYRLGLALLDLEDPTIVLRRGDEWIFGPKENYEKQGDVDNVVFPCGWIHDKKNGLLHMYYGAADSSICLATAKMKDVFEYIKLCPVPDEHD